MPDWKTVNAQTLMDPDCQIVAAFPGVGKTELAKQNDQVLDLDSTPFSKLTDGTQNPDFPGNYILEVLLQSRNYKAILISSHKDVRAMLYKNNLPYTLVVPDPDLKDVFLQRYLDRGNPHAFVDLVSEHWDHWLEEIHTENVNPYARIDLITIHHNDTYLSDMLQF